MKKGTIRESLKCFFRYLEKFLSAFTKRVACPEGADLGFGGFPQQAKNRLGSTQTLLAAIVPKTVYDSSALSVHISHWLIAEYRIVSNKATKYRQKDSLLVPALRIQQHLLTFNHTIVTVLIGIDLFREILTKRFISQKYGVIINKPNKFHKKW